jgi:hypothetical protein
MKSADAGGPDRRVIDARDTPGDGNSVSRAEIRSHVMPPSTAIRGESSLALDELDRAYAAGWRDGRTRAIDPFFASVRTEPRLQQLAGTHRL